MHRETKKKATSSTTTATKQHKKIKFNNTNKLESNVKICFL